jgi:hypothetical protein
MTFVVGAYAALTSSRANQAEEEAFYGRLAANSNVSGFEIPFQADTSSAVIHRIANYVGGVRQSVLSTIPGTVACTRADPTFGLASTTTDGRRAALAFAADALQRVREANDRIGALAVVAIHFAAAPRGATSDATVRGDRLADSLAEMLEWRWDGVRPVLEHCDALVPSHEPAKGFLSFAEEIRAIDKAHGPADARVGMCINWGRSAIEARDVSGPLRHIAAASLHGVLAGVMFSGCSSEATTYGPPWSDVHLPPAPDGDCSLGEPLSLLTRAEIVRSLQEVGDRSTTYIGLKIAAPSDDPLSARMALVEQGLMTLRDAEDDSLRGSND